MNASNFAHAGLALAAQILIACALFCAGAGIAVSAAIGGAFAIGFYYGREVDQVEKKHLRTPWYVGFKFKYWGADNLMDFAFPAVACALLTAAALALEMGWF